MRLLALTLLLALAACAAPVAPAPTASVAPSGSTAPTSTPRPSLAPAPSATPLPTLNPDLGLTPTPPFPQGKITPQSLGDLRLLRGAGYGFPQVAAFVGDNRLAVGTSAGLLWLDLPGLAPGRFEPLPGGVSQLAANPNGVTLAFAADPDQDGRQVTTITRAADGVALAQVAGAAPVFSPDGALLATWRADAPDLTTLWRAASGEQIATLRGRSPLFSPDGSLAVTHESNTTALLSRTSDGEVVANLAEGRVGAAFSPDGARLAVAGPGGLRLFPLSEAGAGEPLLLSSASMSGELAFSADGAQLSAMESMALVAWDIASAKEVTRMAGMGADITWLGPRGTLLAAISAGGDAPSTTQILRGADGRFLYEDPFLVSSSAFFSPDGGRAAVLRSDGGVILIDAERGVIAERALRGYSAVAFSPDGGLMAAGSGVAQVDIWQVGGGALLRQLSAEAGFSSLSRLSFSRDGAQVLAEQMGVSFGSDGAPLHVVALKVDGSGGEAVASTSLDKGVYEISEPLPWAYSQPAGRLAWFDHAGRLRLLDGSNALLDLAGPYGALAFSPDGDLLAAAQDAGSVRLFRSADGGDVAALDAERTISQLVFSPDGSLLAGRSADGALTVWRIADQARFADLRLDPDRPGAGQPSLLFSADNSLFIAGGAGGVAFYNLANGHELRRLDLPASGLALGPEQHLLAVLSQGRATLWGVP